MILAVREACAPYGRRVGCSVELESTINISSMSQFDYEDNQLRVPYLVNDSVLTLSHTISVAAPCEFLATGGPGISCQEFDPANYTLSILLRGDGQKLFLGRGLDQNPISSHYASVP